jgi:hypothetical protein
MGNQDVIGRINAIGLCLVVNLYMTFSRVPKQVQPLKIAVYIGIMQSLVILASGTLFFVSFTLFWCKFTFPSPVPSGRKCVPKNRLALQIAAYIC